MVDSGVINSGHEPNSVQCPFERRTLAETLKVKELGPDGFIYCEELFVKLFAVPQPHLSKCSPAATVVLYDVIVWISPASTACLAPPTDSTLGSVEMRWTGLRRSLQDACLLEMFLKAVRLALISRWRMTEISCASESAVQSSAVAALTKSMMGNNLLTTQLNYHIASNKHDAAFSSKMFNFHIWCHVVVFKLCMYIPKHYCSAISEWDMWLLLTKLTEMSIN